MASVRPRHVESGLRYDVEFPPQVSAPPNPLALTAYNQLGLQKGIQTDSNNIQPRIGVAWDPKGDGKTVVRASYGMFYDHPLLGLYFLGDASDGSRSGQALLFGATPAMQSARVSAEPDGQLTLSRGWRVSASQRRSRESVIRPTSSNSTPSCPIRYSSIKGTWPAGVPLVNQPFGYPQAKNFVYAYSQQANFAIERNLGGGFALSLAYNYNSGRHLNRPINANTVRGDLLVQNWQAAVGTATAAGIKPRPELSPATRCWWGRRIRRCWRLAARVLRLPPAPCHSMCPRLWLASSGRPD